MGGPIGRRLILKHDLLKTAVMEDDATLVEDEKKHKRSVSMYAPATYQIAIAMGLGTIVSWALSKTGMTFPIYIGAMIVAAAMRNISEHTNLFTVNMGEIRYRWYMSFIVLGHSNDYIEIMATCIIGTSAIDTSCRTSCVDVCIYVFRSI